MQNVIMLKVMAPLFYLFLTVLVIGADFWNDENENEAENERWRHCRKLHLSRLINLQQNKNKFQALPVAVGRRYYNKISFWK